MAGRKALGRLFDVGVAVTPADIHGATSTGKRVSLANASGVSVVLVTTKAASGAGNLSLVFGAYAAATGGSASSTNVAPTSYYQKTTSGTWDNTQTWTDVTGATNTGGTVALTGASTLGGVFVFEVLASQMPDGFPHLEVDLISAGTIAQLGTLVVVPHDLEIQRDPGNLAGLA